MQHPLRSGPTLPVRHTRFCTSWRTQHRVPVPTHPLHTWHLQVMDMGCAHTGLKVCNGLVKEEQDLASVPLSHKTGTRLLMAPEVIAEQAYGQTVDGEAGPA